MIDLLGLGALAIVCIEWLALGAVCGVAGWPTRLLVGAFFIGLAQLLLALVGVGFGTGLAVLVVAGALAYGVHLLGGSSPITNASSSARSRAEVVGWVVLCTVLAAALIRSVLVPEAGWDAFSHWGLKAEAYAIAGTIVDTHTVHEEYPPLVPLFEAWFSMQRGTTNGVSIDLAKTVWAVVGGAFGLALAGHFKLVLQRAWLAPYLATGVVLGTTQLLEDFWTGQADLGLTVFLTLATLAALQWLRAPSRAWLVQAALFGAAAALTKYEGLPRVAVVAVALALEGALMRRGRDPNAPRVAIMAGVLVLAAAAAFGVWVTFELAHGMSPVSSEHVAAFQPQAIGTVVVTLASVLAGVRTGGGVLVAVAAALVAGRRVAQPPMRFLSLVVLGQAAATLIAFLIADTPPDLEVRTAATRLIEQFLPVALFASAVWLSELGTYNRPWR